MPWKLHFHKDMNTFKISFLFLFFSFSALVQADQFNAKDIQTVVKFAQQYVMKTEKPVRFYSWGPAGDYLQETSGASPKGYQKIVRGAKRFWENRKSNLNGFYGSGLYFSFDPVSTRTYGGESKSAMVTRIELPVGSRILIFPGLLLKNNIPMLIPNEVKAALWRLSGFTTPLPPIVEEKPEPELTGPPPPPTTADDKPVEPFTLAKLFSSPYFNMIDLFQSFSPEFTEKYYQALDEIFSKQLGIVGFAYPYYTLRYIPGRLPQDPEMGAFVLTGSSGIEPKHVKIYHAQTQDEIEERRLLQSMFYYSVDLTYDLTPEEKIKYQVREDQSDPQLPRPGYPTLIQPQNLNPNSSPNAGFSLYVFSNLEGQKTVELPVLKTFMEKYLWEYKQGPQYSPAF